MISAVPAATPVTTPVDEPTVDQAKQILKGLVKSYEKYHDIRYTKQALDAAVDLSAKFILDRFLPDKAIDVIDAAAARQRIKPAGKRAEKIDVAQIRYEISLITKIPEDRLSTIKEEIIKLKRENPDWRFNEEIRDRIIELEKQKGRHCHP